jgi:hypothetical protein
MSKLRFRFFANNTTMKYIILGASSFFTVYSLSQEVIATQGGSYSSSTASIDFTIGEPVIQTVSDGNSDLTQGFHQTLWNFVGMEDHAPEVTVLVFPNPMTQDLIVQGELDAATRYQMYDANGRLILEGNIEGSETRIAVQQLAAGPYTLNLITAGSVMKSFKLIKNH